MDLSFSGAGFMGCYYFGVVDCWNRYIPRERVNRCAGTSAGSLIAAYYLMDLPIETCLKEIIEMTVEIRSRSLGVFDRDHQLVDMLPKLLDRLFPDDAHKQCSGRLHICMTRLKDMKKVIVNEFESKKELIEALNCSCFIPVWSGNHVSTYRGVKHIDGIFSDNLPVFDENTIKICCFSGQTDISPIDRSQKEMLSSNFQNTPLYFTMANFRRGARALWPPPATVTLDMLVQGFHDTKCFILDSDLIQCDSCYQKFKATKDEGCRFSRPNPTISPAVSRAVSPAINRRRLASSQKQQQLTALSASNLPTVDWNRLNEPTSASCLDLKAGDDRFHELLNDKLKRSHSPRDSMDQQELKNLTHFDGAIVPSIVIDSNEEQQQNEQQENLFIKSEDKPTKKKPRVTSTLSERRKSLASCPQDRPLAVGDKFKLAPNPLPSCPPSPNLNRHCKECLRLRQAARNDHLEETILEVVESFCSTAEPLKGGGIKSKLSVPWRWLRTHLRTTTHSYKFEHQPGVLG